MRRKRTYNTCTPYHSSIVMDLQVLGQQKPEKKRDQPKETETPPSFLRKENAKQKQKQKWNSLTKRENLFKKNSKKN